MGRNWLVARIRSDHELVTSGPFAHVRHPIYSALALLLFALAVGLSNAWRLIVTLQLYAHGTWLHIAEEEKLLHAMWPRFRGLCGPREAFHFCSILER